MIQVSNTYNPYTTVRDVDMVVSLDVINEEADEDATYEPYGVWESISNFDQLHERNYEDVKYATCEDDLVMLDGSWQYLNDTITNEHIGAWSVNISNSNGEFGIVPPAFYATLSEEFSCAGFTMYSSETNPVSECIVRVRRYGVVIYEETFTSDTNVMSIELAASNFNLVDITITKTKDPYRRAKILGFRFGIIKEWNRDKIVSANITEEANIAGETLPINELSFEVDNSTGEFNILDSNMPKVYAQAISTASISSVNANSISNISQIKSSSLDSSNYATCEDDLVMLDGSFKYLASPPYASRFQIGYVNNTLSDSNGEFSNEASVTYSWNSNISSILGIKFYFAEQNYATSITVSAYSGNTLINSDTFENNDEIVYTEFAVANFDKLVFTFNSVSEPNRYVKVLGIKLMHYEESWIQYLAKNQHVRAKFVINGESVSMGDNYLFDKLEQTNSGLTAKITAKNYVRQLDDQRYAEARHGTDYLYNALDELLADTGLTVKYTPQYKKNSMVSLSAPKDTTRRAAIHYYAQAARTTCFLNRRNELEIRAFDSSNYVDTLDRNNMYKSGIARMNDYVNMIRLTVKDEYVDPPFEQTYYGGSGLYYREIENHCVYTGSNNAELVALWLLDQKSRRIYFEIETRGNPAIELGDTIKVVADDGAEYLAIVYYQNFEYNGGLKATIKAAEKAAVEWW